LHTLLQPRSIALIGATETARPDFIFGLRSLGFTGEIHVVNPRYPEVHGIKSYASLLDLPAAVDYAILAVPARAVPGVIEDCARKGVKIAHLYTGRFSETGRPQDAELEREVLKVAKRGGVRLIGPNCMGLYYPRLGIGWTDDFPTDAGPVGMASQSSYAPHDLIVMAKPRGIRFSKVIGYGNALDLNECDFLEYLTEDPETKVIMMYIEGVKDGKRFLSYLREATKRKPVILTKGGKGEAGGRAAASHTGSLAGSIQAWQTAVAQAGAIPADSLEELMDYALTFSMLGPISGPRVGIAGSGGGPSVLAADQCEAAGLEVVPLPDEIRQELKARQNPAWDWVGNPVDMTIGIGVLGPGEMLRLMAAHPSFDILIAIVGEPHYAKRQANLSAEAMLTRFGLGALKEKPLLAVVPDKSLNLASLEEPTARLMCDIRTKLLAAGVPVYPTMGRAARSARALLDHYRSVAPEKAVPN